MHALRLSVKREGRRVRLACFFGLRLEKTLFVSAESLPTDGFTLFPLPTIASCDCPTFKYGLNAGESVVHNRGMNDQQSFDIRRRIRELLSIPDRDRTDEQWDELIELEIRTAPGNRDSAYPSEKQGDKRVGGSSARRQNHNQKNVTPRPDRPPQESRPDVRLPKRQHRRPKRQVQQTDGVTDNANTSYGYSDNTGSTTEGGEGQS